MTQITDQPDSFTQIDRSVLSWWVVATSVMVLIAWIIATPHNIGTAVIAFGYVLLSFITWLFVLPNKSPLFRKEAP